jgi:hypothetical protein
LVTDTFEALTPWEQALCLARIRRETGWTLAETAKQFGRSIGWVQARHDLTRIPEHAPLRAAIEANQITMTDANTLATMPAAEQARLLPLVIAGEVNVQQLRDMKPRRPSPATEATRHRGSAIRLAPTPGRQAAQDPGVGAPPPTTAAATGSPLPTSAPPPVAAAPEPVHDPRHPGDDAAQHDPPPTVHERVQTVLAMLDDSDAGVVLPQIEELLRGIDPTDPTPLSESERARRDGWVDLFTRSARLLIAIPG